MISYDDDDIVKWRTGLYAANPTQARDLVAALDAGVVDADALRTLDERVAFAEQARDNAVQQRDEATERAKRKAAAAGRCITALIALVRDVCTHTTPVVKQQAEERMRAILVSEASPR